MGAALSSFHDKIISGESPEPEELLAQYPENQRELETIVSLLYCGKAVLAPEAQRNEEDEEEHSPCSDLPAL